MSFYSYDKTVIVGQVGKDAEMRYTPSGTAVTSFSVAVDRSYKDKNGEMHKKTIWYRVQVWGKLAEICAKIAKGEKLLVEGELEPDENGGPRVWTKQDGTPAASFELKANEIKFLSAKTDKQTVKDEAKDEEFPF